MKNDMVEYFYERNGCPSVGKKGNEMKKTDAVAEKAVDILRCLSFKRIGSTRIAKEDYEIAAVKALRKAGLLRSPSGEKRQRRVKLPPKIRHMPRLEWAGDKQFVEGWNDYREALLDKNPWLNKGAK